MFANRLRIFLTLAAAVGVSAQTSGLDTCILNCLTVAEGNSTCTSFTDISCVCSNKAFQETANSCLQANCTTQDLQTALQLQNQECGSSNSSSAVPTSTGAGANSTSKSTSSAPASTSKSPNAASRIEQLPFLTGIIAIAGVALGGAYAL